VDLKNLQENWHAFGRRDPLWAILTHPDKRGNRWDPKDFFKSGAEEIESVVAYVSSLRPALRRNRALDFGCGVGRLTQALADHFVETYGVDIAPSMVSQAEQFNRHGNKVQYLLNQKNDLTIFADNTFDLVYSNIVLQHMEPQYALNYIKEFIRIISPGGLILFHLPSEPMSRQHMAFLTGDPKGSFLQFSPSINKLYRQTRRAFRWYAFRVTSMFPRLRQPEMEMYGIPRNEVEHFLEASAATLVDVRESNTAGPNWKGFQYCVDKSE
jgi:ubiquinone/menaquinone biosynthesis C-methylase UbiE